MEISSEKMEAIRESDNWSDRYKERLSDAFSD